MARPTAVRKDFRDFVVGNDFRFSDTLTFTGAGDLNTSGAVLRVTMRHPVSGAIIGEASTETDGNITADANGEDYDGFIHPLVTAAWPAYAKVAYDVQLSFANSDESYTQWWGYIETLPAITQALIVSEYVTANGEVVTADGEPVTVEI